MLFFNSRYQEGDLFPTYAKRIEPGGLRKAPPLIFAPLVLKVISATSDFPFSFTSFGYNGNYTHAAAEGTVGVTQRPENFLDSSGCAESR